MAGKWGAPGHDYHVTVGVDDLVRDWEADGFGPMLSTARERRERFKAMQKSDTDGGLIDTTGGFIGAEE